MWWTESGSLKESQEQDLGSSVLMFKMGLRWGHIQHVLLFKMGLRWCYNQHVFMFKMELNTKWPPTSIWWNECAGIGKMFASQAWFLEATALTSCISKPNWIRCLFHQGFKVLRWFWKPWNMSIWQTVWFLFCPIGLWCWGVCLQCNFS